MLKKKKLYIHKNHIIIKKYILYYMYKDKYIKYKTKYLALKNILDGNPNIIQYGGRDVSIGCGSVVPAAATTMDAHMANVSGKTGGGGSGCTWDALHLLEWSDKVASLHKELRKSLEQVWKTQTVHLRKLRLKAEHAFKSSQRPRPAVWPPKSKHDVLPKTLDVETVRRKNVLEKWSSVLAEHDTSWAELQAEKRAGWESEAVEWYWQQRDAAFGHGDSSKVDRVNNRGLVPSTRKYVIFYREWMPKLSPVLFGRTADESHPRVFADVGSAPGGMCEYLVGDLGWSGFAFSLAPMDDGFGMQFASPRLTYADSDVSIVGEWRRLLKLVGGNAVCNFVNGGVVIDRGQQHAEQNDTYDTLGTEQHIKIYRNTLLFGLHALRPGGALYFAYQLGQTALLMRLLLVLRPAFASVRVTPTFAVGRTPMYVWLGEYMGLETAAAATAVRFLLESEMDICSKQYNGKRDLLPAAPRKKTQKK
jgi:hypothetical protein